MEEYWHEPSPEEHYKVCELLGEVLEGDDDAVLGEAAVANVAVEEAFSRLRRSVGNQGGD